MKLNFTYLDGYIEPAEIVMTAAPVQDELASHLKSERIIIV